MRLSQATVEKHWRDMFHGHPNFMTPDVVKLEQSRSEQFIIELSKGDDLEGQTMYGIIVVELGGYGRSDEHRRDLCKSFTGDTAKRDALRYFKEVSNVAV